LTGIIFEGISPCVLSRKNGISGNEKSIDKLRQGEKFFAREEAW